MYAAATRKQQDPWRNRSAQPKTPTTLRLHLMREPGLDVRAEFERAMKDVYVRAKSEALLLVFDETLGFVQGELPWEGIELLAAGSGRVRLDLAGSEKHTHALVAELADRPLERTPVG